MSRSFIFPTFHYEPLSLKTVASQIQKKYQHGDQPSISLTRKKLPNLLAQIRKLNNDKSTIIAYANTLKTIDINVLSTEYPYEQEDIETIQKITIIVTERYNRLVGRRFWQHYQSLPLDEQIIQVLQYCFQHEKEDFLALQLHVRGMYDRLFQQSEPLKIISSMATEIGSVERAVEDTLKDWKIEQDSLLYHELWYLILLQYMNKLWFVEKQGLDFIFQKLEYLSLEKYKKIIEQYLLGLNHEDYHDEIFAQTIQRLNDPRENLSRWQGMSEKSIEKAKKRLRLKELFDFFGYDSERFDYWKRYLDRTKDYGYVKEPPIVAMYFGDFVVVEFAEVGNAAYFYEQEGFKRHLAYKLKHNVSASLLKDQAAPYYIHKLNHSGNWPQRYDQYMYHYLRGNFHYKF